MTMEQPYIDVVGGPVESVPPAPVVDWPFGTLYSVVGNADASVLLAIAGIWGYGVVVSYDRGATWAPIQGVSLGNSEWVPLEIDLWFDAEAGRFVAQGSISCSAFADVDAVGWEDWAEDAPLWMSSVDGALWQRHDGEPPPSPGAKWWVVGERDPDEQWGLFGLFTSEEAAQAAFPERNPQRALALPVEGGTLLTGWPVWDSLHRSDPLVLFSTDEVTWVRVNTPETTTEYESNPLYALRPGMMGRFAALPGNAFYVTRGTGWHGAVEFHLGVAPKPLFWMHHLKTVEQP